MLSDSGLLPEAGLFATGLAESSGRASRYDDALDGVVVCGRHVGSIFELWALRSATTGAIIVAIAWWTVAPRATVTHHSLTHFSHLVGELHELVAAKMIVAVFVKTLENRFWIRWAVTIRFAGTWAASATFPCSSFTFARAVLVHQAATLAAGWTIGVAAWILQGALAVEVASSFAWRRFVRSSTFSAAWWTWRSHFFGELHELVAAELAVAIGIEAIKQLARIRRSARSTTSAFGAAPFGTFATHAVAVGSITALTIAAAATHFFACFGPFVVTQFAVAIGVELVHDTLSHFSSAAFAIDSIVGPGGAGHQH